MRALLHSLCGQELSSCPGCGSLAQDSLLCRAEAVLIPGKQKKDAGKMCLLGRDFIEIQGKQNNKCY